LLLEDNSGDARRLASRVVGEDAGLGRAYSGLEQILNENTRMSPRKRGERKKIK
jgi:hypothetical protein